MPKTATVVDTVTEFAIGEAGLLKVVAQTGRILHIRGMWSGRWQDVVVDPEEVDDLIAALEKGRAVSEGRDE